MKKFILKTIFYAVLIMVLINVLLFYTATENHFIRGIVLKHQLLEQTPSPRLILIGGSGTSYSIDSEMITQQTGLHTINMGLFAQFGLRYMLEEVKDDIKNGDLILVIPEYHHFYYFFEGWRGFNELIYVYPKALTHLSSWEQVKIIVKAFPRFFRTKVNTLGQSLRKKLSPHRVNKIYYNQHGDYVDHLESTEKFEVEKLTLFDDFIDTARLTLNREVVPVLNEFNQQMQNQGAEVYFVFPTIPEQQYIGYQHFIKKVENAMKENTDLKLLNQPQNALQPNEDFYNTVYHLNKEGREKRTLKLIEMIKNRYEVRVK